MSSAILDWDAAFPAGPGRAGGKGWQLAAASHLGLPVPAGFVIDAEVSKAWQPGQPAPAILAAAIANELAARNWADVPLAVRSSATSEDSRGASFAGLYRSHVNVVGAEAVVAAVLDVWESLNSASVEAYRQRLQLESAGIGMAVIVMPLVAAQVSGVAFSADPLTGRADQIVIHANWGFGESIVSGQVQPDEFVLESPDAVSELRILARRLGSKRRSTRALPAGGGISSGESDPATSARYALTDGQVLEIGRLVREAAQVLDYADPRYDFEWAWDGQQFWILQARPITAAARRTYPQLREQPTWWSRANSRDVVPDPLSPLDWSLSQILLARMLGQTSWLAGYRTMPGLQRFRLMDGRLYFNASVLQWEAYDGFGVPPRTVNRIMGGHQPELAVPPALLKDRAARTTRSLRYLVRCIGPRRRAEATLRRIHDETADWLRTRPRADPAAQVQWLRQKLAIVSRADDLFFLQASSASAHVILLDLLAKYFPEEAPGLAASLLGTGKPSVTAQQTFALAGLADVAARDAAGQAWLHSEHRRSDQWREALPPDSDFRRAFASFLDCYGHRAVYESYLRNPRWREDPGYLLDNIAAMQGSDVVALHRRQRQAAEDARRRISRRLPIHYRTVLPAIVRAAITERNLREAARNALASYLEVIRLVALDIAGHFPGPQGLADAQGVFNLTLEELMALGEGSLAPQAAAQRASWRGSQLSAFLACAPREVIAEHGGVGVASVFAGGHGAEASGDCWRGDVVSGGIACATARVIHHPREGQLLNDGEIIVAPSTDPSWAPLFLRAGGLVLETGGYLSHGAIIAREFGIPAVTNVRAVLDEVRSGDMLKVDAWSGVVMRILPSDARSGA